MIAPSKSRLKSIFRQAVGGQEEIRLSRPRILFLNRSLWPDTGATGQLLDELCEDLAASFEVTVIAGHSKGQAMEAASCRRGTEVRKGVTIRRVWHTQFPKHVLAGRLANYVSFLFAALWVAMWGKRPDLVVVETDPPLLCLIGWYLQRFRHAKLVAYLQDLHPDIGIALGKIPGGRLTLALRQLLFRIYRSADRVIVLSRDMQERVIDSGVDHRRVVCIPNWISTKEVRPVKRKNSFRTRHGINDRFVIMYSGNLGLCQGLEDVVAAATYLQDRPNILLLLIGEGVIKRQLQDQVNRFGLSNVRFLPSQPKSILAESLSAADVHLVPLDPRIASCLMPSKLYGVLASGTPLVAIAPEECELAEITRANRVGVVVPPGRPRFLADTVASLAHRRQELTAMGKRARRLAKAQFDRKRITPRFRALLVEVLNGDESRRDCIAEREGSRYRGPRFAPANVRSSTRNGEAR